MSDIGFECPQCGGLLVVDAKGAGMSVNCTQCSKTIRVPDLGPAIHPNDIKMACPHCGQHLDAPPEIFGQTTACPACRGQITIPNPNPSEFVSWYLLKSFEIMRRGDEWCNGSTWYPTKRCNWGCAAVGFAVRRKTSSSPTPLKKSPSSRPLVSNVRRKPSSSSTPKIESRTSRLLGFIKKSLECVVTRL